MLASFAQRPLAACAPGPLLTGTFGVREYSVLRKFALTLAPENCTLLF